jgi:hypothetical protein
MPFGRSGCDDRQCRRACWFTPAVMPVARLNRLMTSTLLTDLAYHCPPRGVVILRASKASAIWRSDMAPARRAGVRWNTPVEVQLTSAGRLNYPCRTPGGAKTSFVKKCKQDACEGRAVSAEGKPLSGAAKN